MKIIAVIIALIILIVLFVSIFAFIGKAIYFWFEASNKKKETFTFILMLLLLLVSIYLLGFNNSKDGKVFGSFLMLCSPSLHYSFKEFRKKGGFKSEDWSNVRYQTINLFFIGPWKSKWHWASVLQIAPIFLY